MSFVKDRRAIVALTLLLAAATAIAGFYWNEARKEVVFLCGNFTAGVSRASVVEQLATVNLSTVSVVALPAGSRIELSSPLNFRLYRCVIDFDASDTVIQAGLK
jgi:hypothetical protein